MKEPTMEVIVWTICLGIVIALILEGLAAHTDDVIRERWATWFRVWKYAWRDVWGARPWR
jgi:hypothetical protein